MPFLVQYLHQALTVVAVQMNAARIDGSQTFLARLQEGPFRFVRSTAVKSSFLRRRLSIGRRARIDEWFSALADHGARVRFEKGFERPTWREWIREILRPAERSDRSLPFYATRIEIDGAVIGLQSEWTPRTTLGEGGQLNKVEWDVLYRERRFDFVDAACSVQEASRQLRAALERAEDLCQRHEWSKYREIFAGARQVLLGEGEFTPYGGQLLDPRLYSEDARLLFESANAAWVFGGMGSFSDMVLSTRKETDDYQACAHDLLVAIDQAIMSAVNVGSRHE